MTAAQYSRGQVVLADFPFTERPHERGPRQHFCLVIDTVESQEERLIAICYGTSRLDDDLLAAHGGGVLSIPRAFMKIRSGFMDEVVGHFVLDHVALVPESWLDPRFSARLDFMREEARKNDPIRERLFKAFVACEPVMQMAALQAALHTQETGRIGLPPGKTIRTKTTR
ncbi:hypothetical protein [Ottowia sp.]|uniref:hypothetical protein n=1 Tax=Ottowia sp. TaxID=1898956 RepID=UPI0025DAB600|nr:hypothetical protein [Ottowia sp.]MBK6616318.1 hypothetical protein [Ottowia sp.]